jgi:4-hydroxybenzoyl-CoA reductase subunit beta
MMRLPRFEYVAPSSVQEAAERLAERGDAMLVAGGTDVLPNMKRRQQTPRTLIGLRNIAAL